jgi:hypothetical protein
MCMHVYMCAATRRILKVNFAMLCMYAFVCVCISKIYAHCYGCEAMHVCAFVCDLVNEAYAHNDDFEVMHVCAFVCGHEQGVCSR